MDGDILPTEGVELSSQNASQRSRHDETERTPYRNSAHAIRAFEVLQSLREDEVLCDIKLDTVDGTTVCGHKVVLASASPYFRAMFTSFEASIKDHVIIKELDSAALKLLVDFIYTAQIMVTEENVRILLPAANLLRLHDVRDACCDFLRTRLHPTNCLGTKALADSHGCMELLSSSESYIQQHFSEVVQGDKFLSLSSEPVVKPISGDELTVPYDEKGILVVCGHELLNPNLTVEWYDPVKNRWRVGPEMNTRRYGFGLAVLKDCCVYAVGGRNEFNDYSTVDMLDLSLPSPCWVPSVAMLTNCDNLGVAVLDNCIYAVGGSDGINRLNSAEVFDCSTQEWRMISCMSTRRSSFGVGVLNNLLYVVGGLEGLSNQCLKSVECYNPSTDTWTPVADMCVRRVGAGVGVLDGVMYAVGGHDDHISHNSVEAYRPSTGIWTSIADMHMCRRSAGVIALDGLLYVVGGDNMFSELASVEIYNPNTNTWSMLEASMNIGIRSYTRAVVIDKPSDFNV